MADNPEHEEGGYMIFYFHLILSFLLSHDLKLMKQMHSLDFFSEEVPNKTVVKFIYIIIFSSKRKDSLIKPSS